MSFSCENYKWLQDTKQAIDATRKAPQIQQILNRNKG